MANGVMCNKRIPAKTKDKIFKSVNMPNVMLGFKIIPKTKETVGGTSNG